jgi:hypothetical protein
MLRCCSHLPGAGATALHSCSKLWAAYGSRRLACRSQPLAWLAVATRVQLRVSRGGVHVCCLSNWSHSYHRGRTAAHSVLALSCLRPPSRFSRRHAGMPGRQCSTKEHSLSNWRGITDPRGPHVWPASPLPDCLTLVYHRISVSKHKRGRLGEFNFCALAGLGMEGVVAAVAAAALPAEQGGRVLGDGCGLPPPKLASGIYSGYAAHSHPAAVFGLADIY